MPMTLPPPTGLCLWCGLVRDHDPRCVVRVGGFTIADDPRDALDEGQVEDVVRRAIDVRLHPPYPQDEE